MSEADSARNLFVEESRLWEKFHFNDLHMEFTSSGGIERAIATALASGAKSIAIVSKERYFDVVQSLNTRLKDGESDDGQVKIVNFSQIIQHVPDSVASRAQSFAISNQTDAIVTVGGGSAIGTAKVMALAITDMRAFVAVPTTFSGSEMTPIYGVTTGGNKVTTRDERIRPTAVIYDNSLLSSLPYSIAIPSIANALAHACEALWVPTKTRTSSLFALGAINSISNGLSSILSSRISTTNFSIGDEYLAKLAYGSALAGIAFGSTGSGIHHKICHLIGGKYNLDHALTHMIVGATLLPAMASRYASEASIEISRAEDLIKRLIEALDLPRDLKTIGLHSDEVSSLLESVYDLSRQVHPSPDRDELTALFRDIVG
ncbi:MAG: iron-containing alcohol dehydrogenase [Actinomycetota bacterium]|nr:iron-containing alcohol dehydrogenase [Actinomycetota bacterium]